MKIYNTLIRASLIILITMMNIHPSQAETPTGQDELRIHTGNPKQSGESIISVTARWRTDQGLLTGSTSLIIVNGPDRRHSDDGLSIAQKVSKAMKISMIDHHPNMRGLTINVVEDADDPQIVVKNNRGHSFTLLTLRDYTNQKFTVDIGGKSSSKTPVKVAIDLVDASGVDFVDEFNPKSKVQQLLRASGGGVNIRMGSGKSRAIKTKNRALEEIEKTIASKVGGRFRTSPLFADEKERDKRNIKPFDGGDVQFAELASNSFTVELNDSSLGIITRYQFSDAKGSSGGAASNLPLIIVLVLVGVGGFYYFTSVRTKKFDPADQK